MTVMSEGRAVLNGSAQQVMDETELLRSAGVMLPRRAELSGRLAAEGLYRGGTPLNIPSAAEMIRGMAQ